jgi:hypothetical protein
MPNISRRQFLEGATVGAAAVGAIAAAPSIIGTASRHDVSTGSFQRAAAVSAVPASPTAGVVAHVVDAKSGKIVVYAGTREVSFTNTDIARALLAAAK